MKSTKICKYCLFLTTFLLIFCFLLNRSYANATNYKISFQATKKAVNCYVINSGIDIFYIPHILNRHIISDLVFIDHTIDALTKTEKHDANVNESTTYIINTIKPETSTQIKQTLKTSKKPATSKTTKKTTKKRSDKISKNDAEINLDKNNGKENLINNDDLFWLARIIEAEAGAEPYNGKLAVGCVVVNRKNSANFPSSIYGVIFDNKYGVQFTPTTNGAIYNDPSKDSYDAALEVLAGYLLDDQILYFVNHDKSSSTWFETKTFVFKIGNHSFYK